MEFGSVRSVSLARLTAPVGARAGRSVVYRCSSVGLRPAGPAAQRHGDGSVYKLSGPDQHTAAPTSSSAAAAAATSGEKFNLPKKEKSEKVGKGLKKQFRSEPKRRNTGPTYTGPLSDTLFNDDKY